MENLVIWTQGVMKNIVIQTRCNGESCNMDTGCN